MTTIDRHRGAPAAVNPTVAGAASTLREVARAPLPAIVAQHVEEAAQLRRLRSVLVRAPHVRLGQLAHHDQRIAAHLDGIGVAGAHGATLIQRSLERVDAGSLFVAATRALETRDADRLDKLLAISQAVPASQPGVLSALGWASTADLRGITKSLLESTYPWQREAGLAACAMHGVDPGAVLGTALRDADASLRARALRVAGRCGRRDLLGACLAALGDADASCAFESAWSALLLGDRTDSLATLESLAVKERAPNPLHLPALRLVLKVLPPKRAQSTLATLAKDPALVRAVIRGVASAGDPRYVPWLISQMDELKLTRLAGETFSFMTGLDLAHLGLERELPENMEFGPNNDPEDDNVLLDEDDSLPWPDPVKIGAWWKSNGARFTPGTRYFMGEVPTPAKCIDVLKTGFQRQRIAAAEYLTLLVPGTPLFNVAAPAWRQQRLLSKMVA